jgi:hypothetical protein
VDVQSVDSSVLAAVGYDGKQHVLEATFRTGRVYRYFDVPTAVYKALLNAPSAGKYFNRNIRDRYRAELVYDPR